MNADGSNAIDLKCDDGFICGYPAWSPDSQKIIFNRYEFVNESGAWVSKNYKIFIMNIDGSNRTFITDGIHPLWVP
jgi:Tol biopolymer transport system component